ncbi:MAG: pentapeptide repeat-containing protein [Methylococcales bacterium]
MIYPLTERRISGFNRRSDSSKKRRDDPGQAFNSDLEGANERRFGQDRRQLKLDREKLLESIIAKQSKPKWQQLKSAWQDFMQPILIPLVIGGSSVYVTKQVNDQQIKSADKIAIENRENSRVIAEAELKTEHLSQMAGIFSDILKLINQPSEQKKAKEDTLKQKIMSLSVYGDEALPFLIQLRDEYRGEKYYAKSEESISGTAITTIEKILKLNQHQIKVDFFLESRELLNLPRRKYVNYNLSGSKFQKIILYEADFSHSLLRNTRFIDADLRKANFSNASLINAKFINTNIAGTIFRHSNLQGAKFIKVDLANANFDKAYLHGVKFVGCKNIGSARFPIDYLLKANIEPFKSLPARDYSLLLMHSEDELVAIHESNERSLDNVYKKLNMVNLNELQNKFKELRESTDHQNSNNLLQYTAGLFP